MAQRALGEDRVVELTDGLQGEVPDRYAHLGGVSTLTCTPVSAGGRWLGRDLRRPRRRALRADRARARTPC